MPLKASTLTRLSQTLVSAVGNLLGQSLGALFTLDLGAFDFGSIADSFTDAFGSDISPVIKPKVDLSGLNVNQIKAPDLKLVSSQLSAPDIQSIQAQMVSAPQAAALQPPVAANGRIDGQIVVSAAPGTQIRETSMKSAGNGLNVGMNMAAS